MWLGLAPADMRAYLATLASNHEMNVTIDLLDLLHRRVGSLTQRLIDGQVDVDAGAERVTRTCSVSLLDPQRATGLESATDTMPTYVTRMLAITVSVRPPAVGATVQPWIDVPVFTGPVSRIERADDVLTVEAHGKEFLCAHAAHGTKTWPKGARKSDIVREVLTRMCGESTSRAHIDRTEDRLGAPITLTQNADAWAFCASLAGGTHLWYDATGHARMSRNTARNMYTFHDGPGGTILDEPDTVSDAIETLVNRVIVTGNPPSDNKPAPVAVAVAPYAYPLSPSRIARGGVGQAYTLEIDDNKATTMAQASARANAELNNALAVDTVKAEFKSLPVWHLEPGDRVSIQTARLGTEFLMQKYSLPLTHSGVMTVGANRAVSRRPLLNGRR